MPDATPPKITLTEHPDYLEVRLQATSSTDHILLQFQQLLDHCAVHKPSRVFADLTAITGKYSTLDRYDLGLLGAGFAPHVARIAVLGKPEFLDPGTYHVLMVPRQKRIRDALDKLELWVDQKSSLLESMRMTYGSARCSTRL